MHVCDTCMIRCAALRVADVFCNCNGCFWLSVVSAVVFSFMALAMLAQDHYCHNEPKLHSCSGMSRRPERTGTSTQPSALAKRSSLILLPDRSFSSLSLGSSSCYSTNKKQLTNRARRFMPPAHRTPYRSHSQATHQSHAVLAGATSHNAGGSHIKCLFLLLPLLLPSSPHQRTSLCCNFSPMLQLPPILLTPNRPTSFPAPLLCHSLGVSHGSVVVITIFTPCQPTASVPPQRTKSMRLRGSTHQ